MAWTFEPAGHPVEFLSLTGRARRAGPGDRPLVRAAAARQGPGPQRDPDQHPRAGLQVLRRQRPAAARPQGPGDDAEVPGQSTRASRSSPTTAACRPRRSGSCCARSSSSSRRAPTSFFGEPEFDVDDLLRTDADGQGIISILELSDVMDQPRLFSTFMLWMLAQLYEQLPEAGDLPKPKLCFFFDEAHLLFDDASEALMDQIERTARLIRSKGVGVYFVTQAPADVPSSVLAQLGNRVQHALRAFTPEDADDLRKAARTFPTTEFYDVETTLTSLGTGEALVTVLSPKGVPTPLAATRLVAPDSLMAPIEEVVVPRPHRDEPAVRRSTARPSTATAPTSGSPRASSRRAQAAIAATQEAAIRAGVDPTTAAGMNSMTPAQLEREMQAPAEGARGGPEGRSPRGRAPAPGRGEGGRGRPKARQKTIDTAIRTGGKVVTSRLGPGHRPRDLRDAVRRRQVALNEPLPGSPAGPIRRWRAEHLGLGDGRAGRARSDASSASRSSARGRGERSSGSRPTTATVAWSKANGPGPGTRGPLLAALRGWGDARRAAARGRPRPGLAADRGRRRRRCVDDPRTMGDPATRTRRRGTGILPVYAGVQRRTGGRVRRAHRPRRAGRATGALPAIRRRARRGRPIWARVDAEDRPRTDAARRRLADLVPLVAELAADAGGVRRRGHARPRRPARQQHRRQGRRRVPVLRLGRCGRRPPVRDADDDARVDRAPRRAWTRTDPELSTPSATPTWPRGPMLAPMAALSRRGDRRDGPRPRRQGGCLGARAAGPRAGRDGRLPRRDGRPGCADFADRLDARRRRGLGR